jgi:hypothetical protein
MVMVIGGVLVLVFGILLADVVIDTTTTALTNASIGSFAGAAAIGGLVPFIYFTVVILIAVGMMGIGARGMFTNIGVFTLPVMGMITEHPLAVMTASALALYVAYYWNHQSKAVAQPATSAPTGNSVGWMNFILVAASSVKGWGQATFRHLRR